MKGLPPPLPPDLFEALCDTVPRLVKGKVALLSFFRNCSVSEQVLADLKERVQQDRDSITKYEIVRTVLDRLNHSGNKYLRECREVVRRVTEFNSFDSCYPNDQLSARGGVAKIREMVESKDYFTRIRQEAEKQGAKRRERGQAKAVLHAERLEQMKRLISAYQALFAIDNANARGLALEPVLNELFKVNNISVRESFKLKKSGVGIVEQIDGVVYFEGHHYLVEMKWYKDPLGPDKIASHYQRVLTRAEVRGVLVSASGFTSGAVEQAQHALSSRVCFLATLIELGQIIEFDLSLEAWLRSKIEYAEVDRIVLKTIPIERLQLSTSSSS